MIQTLDKHQIAVDAVNKHHALQKPQELECLLRLLKPGERVLEIGCDAGGTTWALQQIGCYVTGITLEHGAFSSGEPLLCKPNILILGDSHEQDTRERLEFHSTLAYGLILIDGDHTYEGVEKDYLMYHFFCRGIIAFHDICHHDLKYNVGVEQLWQEIAPSFPTVEFIYPPTDWGGIGVMEYGTPHFTLERRIEYAKAHN